MFKKGLKELDVKVLRSVPKEITIADHETALRYFESFPVDFLPYIILLYNDGKILTANLDVDQIATRVAKFDARKRNAGSAINTPEPAAASQ